MAEMTDFEKFFREDFDRLLRETRVPEDQMAQPADQDVSWDRRAAWLLYVEYKKTGLAGPVSPDLFSQ
jgi:hypothetical protein